MGLHSRLREPWAACEAVRSELLAVLERVPGERWFTQEAGRWSVAHQANHLLLSEVGTSKMVRRLIRGDFEGVVRPDGATLYDSMLAVYPFGPTTAPSFLEPRGVAGADEALRKLDEAHGRFFEELQRFQADDPDALASPDPASDFWFTLGGWVRVQALHEAHHLEQIRGS
jgi:hypothetical protein